MNKWHCYCIFMKTLELVDYVALYGQTRTAQRVGLTQGSIWQMLKSGRNIAVIETSDGIFLEERKRIGKPERFGLPPIKASQRRKYER